MKEKLLHSSAFFYASLAVIAVLFIAFMTHIVNDGSPNYSNCYVFSQELVKDELKSPSTAKFPRYDKSFFTTDSKTVTVSAYVDAQNSLGATVRTNYIATIVINSKGEPVSGIVQLS